MEYLGIVLLSALTTCLDPPLLTILAVLARTTVKWHRCSGPRAHKSSRFSEISWGFKWVKTIVRILQERRDVDGGEAQPCLNWSRPMFDWRSPNAVIWAPPFLMGYLFRGFIDTTSRLTGFLFHRCLEVSLVGATALHADS